MKLGSVKVLNGKNETIAMKSIKINKWKLSSWKVLDKKNEIIWIKSNSA